MRKGDFSGRYGRAEVGDADFGGVVVTATGDMAGNDGEVGVRGLSSGAERWRRGLLRNAWRAASDVGEDGDVSLLSLPSNDLYTPPFPSSSFRKLWIPVFVQGEFSAFRIQL